MEDSIPAGWLNLPHNDETDGMEDVDRKDRPQMKFPWDEFN